MTSALAASQMVAGFTAATIVLALAAIVYASRPRARQNRVLAAFFVCSAVMHVSVWGLQPLARDAATAWTAVNFAAWVPAQALYVALLGTLATPMTRWLRGRGAIVGLVVAVVLVEAFRIWRRDLWVADMRFEPPGVWMPTFGPIADAAFLAQIVAHTFGAVASLHAWRRSPRGSVQRRTMAAFATAFLWYDAAVVLYSILAIAPALPAPWDLYWIWFPAMNVVVFASLLAYGILKAQLFDVDLKIKWTLRRGTVAAAFVAVGFVVSELAASLLTAQVGTVLGIAAAGALVFALAPLQRLADRVADTAMPRVQDTEEYRTVRKREVYRAAVETAMQDGVVTEKERDVLATLADALGLSATDARAMEREAMERASAPMEARA